MSYTFQKITWTKISKEPDVSIYGDQEYATNDVILTARKQPIKDLVRTRDGREVYFRSVYYIDPALHPSALSIERLDKLDGELVEDTYVMNSLTGVPKMIRVRTI